MIEATTRRRSIGGLARFVGRHRLASMAVLMALLVAGPWAWWATQLWGLPDVGEPFDVAAFEADQQVPDDRNAFVNYRVAASMMDGLRGAFAVKHGVIEAEFEADWSKADPAWREFVADAGPTLAAWRAGSEKPDARYNHPEGLSMRTLLPVTQELLMLGRLAVLEGSRLEAEGDPAGAWGWYRAALRSSRHLGKHGFQIERSFGIVVHDEASKALTRWASDPRVDAAMLRRALDEVIAIDAMTPPLSESLKLNHLVFVHSLGDPTLIEDLLVSRDFGLPTDWSQELPVPQAARRPIQAARVLAADDRERSLRLARLMTANWLAQVDKPPHRRAKIARNDPRIYEHGPSDPPASRALPPEELSRWLDSSLLASRYFRGLSTFAPLVDLERSRQAALVVHLASELFRREHGGTPPPSPAALVGPYLKALPEAFDATTGPADAKP
jgi:hypothetical protein